MPRQPDIRLLLSHPTHFISLGFGSGLSPKAPGTAGSLAAIPVYYLLSLLLTPLEIALLCIPLFLLGCWVCDYTGRILGVSDHGAIVFDEMVAMWLVMAAAPQNWQGALAAFIAFRLFDIWKPWPIRWLDKHVKGGFGVMLDDLLAAGFAIGVILGSLQFLPFRL
ncbi:phosphatidylglycerophosphatase A family protein [Parachitinimonas caeni]|uniref:Phosphatidylglycerophosphatase A n=1 Tax=Parachitinimonas caeni TaxID=3031301 RepID=A0ABT7DTP5_9NEIS|nr:phosphatidylglycerophosphatase A [Parachitinimonas caeni]MDK2123451.1 phosphatidylglycerophosphatase A [Parachitinimonas caeni]